MTSLVRSTPANGILGEVAMCSSDFEGGTL
jgi:hypothetical protein